MNELSFNHWEKLREVLISHSSKVSKNIFLKLDHLVVYTPRLSIICKKIQI